MENSPHQATTANAPSRATRVVERLASQTVLLAAVVLAATAALAVPFLTMAPTESASTEPTGDVFTARDRIDESFVSAVHPTFLILEHDSGDILTVEVLSGLLAAENSLRDDPDFGPTLISYIDPDTTIEVNGMISIADLVDAELRAQSIDGIAAATDADVKQIGSAIIDQLGERSELLGISAQSSRSESGWTVPAVSLVVLSDNEALGFGNLSIALGGDTKVEQFDRDIQEAFRIDGWQANGVAIDVNLTSQEQGAVAGPFIGFTILAVLLLVGLTFRSYWVLATVSVAFLLLIIWLKGISNLIGLKEDLVLSLIVPVAMISFGVDFAFHAIGRYREERAEGRPATTAVVTGLAMVSGALLLALISDTSAFLANLTSGIESINQFGVGAAIALVSAYVLLGIVSPLVVARIEADVPIPNGGRRSTLLRMIGSFGAAGLTMAAVLMLVYVSPPIGLGLTAATLVFGLVLPFAVRRRRPGPRVGDIGTDGDDSRNTATTGRLAAGVGVAVRRLAEQRRIVLPMALLLTAGAATLAVQVPAEFDVEDFFSGDTDFVVGLDQLDTHVGDRGGEPATVYIEGDLTDPDNLALLAGRIDQIRDLDTPSLARNDDGRVTIDTGVFEIFERALDSELMGALVADRTGVVLGDANADGIPDTREQVEALLTVAADTGIPLDSERLLVSPDRVNTVVQLGAGGETDGAGLDRAVLELGVVDSRAQESVTATRAALEPIAEAMSDDLVGTFVEVTGSALVREASLDGTNRALQLSLPLSVVLCLIIAATFLRSVRYGVAAVVPILMVVAWLYGFMYVAGYAINIVTATIAAVSIGIGIDFAIHYIVRYREELANRSDRLAAVQAAGEGTGTALVASAVSSAVGFGILAFAPMPLFAAYGLLTALMITMALVATLTVLPGVLVVVSTEPAALSVGAEPSPRSDNDRVAEPTAAGV
ncbi:MAG: MMPL family transporter [Acidimicrobiia bacterium]|nr:MMPL family transporter [Acidimicrobiia bacterium]